MEPGSAAVMAQSEDSEGRHRADLTPGTVHERSLSISFLICLCVCVCVLSSISGPGSGHPPDPALVPLPAQRPAGHRAGRGQRGTRPRAAGQPRVLAHQPQRAGGETAGNGGALGQGDTR